MTSNPYDLAKAKTDAKYVDPQAQEPDYFRVLERIIELESPDFLHVQHDFEVQAVSEHRGKIAGLGVKTFLPSHESVVTCVDKMKTYEKWAKAGLKVPPTILVRTEKDLEDAFAQLGKDLWFRATRGGGGAGSLPTSNFQLAKIWIDSFSGWGKFTAAQALTPRSVTWTSIWNRGELVVAQGRERLYWELGNRAVSGITGVTGTGVTVSNQEVDEIAQAAIHAIDAEPNGIWSVDMTYDKEGVPNPTEINIGRFFTTHLFFTRAGLNLPYILIKLAFGEKLPKIKKKINPLPEGLAWVRGMDTEPVLTTINQIEKYRRSLTRLRSRNWKRVSKERRF